ncbi:MAG: cobalt-precorrin-5B (C(1))-methyltransferase CbiD [Erysipelotrichales bacterium]
MSELRSGYSTGSCALAATKAASINLFENIQCPQVKINTPLNQELTIDVYNHHNDGIQAWCNVIKDGGDDIDATNGLEIYAYLKKVDEGIHILGGKGVGEVTKKGLRVEIGKPAINPIPYQMLEKELMAIKERYNYQGGLEVMIVVPNGEEAAKKTFNERLGIVGGISILGTTGIVEPMSEKALIETIKVEIDYYIENNKNEIVLLTPGNYGQAFCEESLNLNIESAIKYSNFVGETLDYLVSKKVKRVLIVSHLGKLVKVAAAIMNTHSKYADGRNEIFCAYAALAGAQINTLENIMNATTSDDIDDLLNEAHIATKTYGLIEDAIKKKIDYRTKDEVQIEFIGFLVEQGVLVSSPQAYDFINELKEEE